MFDFFLLQERDDLNDELQLLKHEKEVRSSIELCIYFLVVRHWSQEDLKTIQNSSN